MMKKILLFAVLFVFCFTMSAQDTSGSTDISFGVKAGVNFATITGDDIYDWESVTAFHGGVMTEFKLSDKFAIQPEVLFTRLGAQATDEYEEVFETRQTLETIREELELKLTYIAIPVMAKYFVTEGFSIETGPQISFLTKSEVEFEAFVDGQSVESGTEDLKDDTKSTDFGWNFGLGYQLENGLNFGARYGLGLTNIVEEKSDR